MNKFKAFSLIEVLISLIIISIIIAALTPVLTKKLKHSQIALSSNESITAECSNNSNFGDKCELCTKQYCIKCGLDNCETGQYPNTKKCSCSDCTDFDENCIACDSKGCTKCNNSPMRYLDNGKCTLCPNGHYCDGVNDYATCPGRGYHCNAEGIHKCSDSYKSGCAACDNTRCTECDASYVWSGSKCEPCASTACTKCNQDKTTCTECSLNWVLNTATQKCDRTCGQAMPGCGTCSSGSYCLTCDTKHYVNTSHTCSECNLENCQKCADNKRDDSPVCETCIAGYYLSNGTCQSCSKFGTECATCNANKCTSCIQGSHLEKDVCTKNDNKFGCSDSNFMQIGNLCVTRKNMGDSYALTIPSTVTIAQAPSEHCYATNQKCCWKGETAVQNGCNSENGGYSGCNRTVCNWSAAKEICEKFNYQGKTWRLPTTNEMNLWGSNSVGLGSNGLMLCDLAGGFTSAVCGGVTNCLGSYDGNCRSYYVWSADTVSTLASYVFCTGAGRWLKQSTYNSFAYSVRCVSDL